MKKEVHLFLGLTGYNREVIPCYAHIADTLVELTKKGASIKLNWTAEHENAFVTLKRQMENSPVLLAPNIDKEFILRTDASDRALGAVLLQEENNLLHSVFYASKRQSITERNYSSSEKECLVAVLWYGQ